MRIPYRTSVAVAKLVNSGWLLHPLAIGGARVDNAHKTKTDSEVTDESGRPTRMDAGAKDAHIQKWKGEDFCVSIDCIDMDRRRMDGT